MHLSTWTLANEKLVPPRARPVDEPLLLLGASRRHPGRPSARRQRCDLSGRWVCIVATFASSLLLSGAAHAERALSATHRVSGRSIEPFAAFVTEASKRFSVPETWIRAVMHVESGGKLLARSQKGAVGLMQIMSRTCGGITRSLRFRLRPQKSARQYPGRCRLHSRAP